MGASWYLADEIICGIKRSEWCYKGERESREKTTRELWDGQYSGIGCRWNWRDLNRISGQFNIQVFYYIMSIKLEECLLGQVH